MTIFPASISFVPGTHRLVVQHATTRLAGPLSHAEAEGMLLRSLCLKLNMIFNKVLYWIFWAMILFFQARKVSPPPTNKWPGTPMYLLLMPQAIQANT